MIQISNIVDNYPNIASIFSYEWFESEVNKKSNHTLIKQLILDDEASFEFIDHFEKCLDMLKDEINKHPKHFKTLKNEKQFKSTLAELEIGLMFKKMGFNIEFEPSVQDRKISDIKIAINDVEVFIEVSTRIGSEVKVIEKTKSGIEVRSFERRSPRKFSEKILEESTQLSKEHPGIVALYFLTTYGPEKRNTIRAFGFSFVWDNDFRCVDPGEDIDNSMISALLLSSPYDEPTLCLNPLAKIPLPATVVKKFEENGIDVIIPKEVNQIL